MITILPGYYLFSQLGFINPGLTLPQVRLATGKKFVVEDACFFITDRGLAAVELRWHSSPHSLHE